MRLNAINEVFYQCLLCFMSSIYEGRLLTRIIILFLKERTFSTALKMTIIETDLRKARLQNEQLQNRITTFRLICMAGAQG